MSIPRASDLKTSKVNDIWCDSYYVQAYQLAASGESEKQIGIAFDTTTSQIKRWRKEKPEFDAAIKKGQKKHSGIKPLDKALNERQRRFVDEFMLDLNIKEAALRAGYSESTATTAGAKLISNPKTKALVMEKLSMMQDVTTVTQERVIKELALIAFANPLELFDENGQMKDIEYLDEKVGRAIKSIKVKTRNYKDAYDDDMAEVTTEIQFWDKVKSLEILGKHLGLIKLPGGSHFQIDNRKQTANTIVVDGENNPYAEVGGDKIIEALEVLEKIKEPNVSEEE